MDPLAFYDSQQFLKATAGVVGLSTLFWLKHVYDSSSGKQKFAKKKEEVERTLPFKTSYPSSNNNPEELQPVRIENVSDVMKRLRQTYATDITKNYLWRLDQLKKLKQMIEENKQEIIKAVQQDLGKKDTQEVLSSEINIPLAELDHTIAHLKHWMRPERVYTTIAAMPASSYIYKDPAGVVLIMSPWNYPVNLALVPLIGAIAGGNAVFLKLSRHSANVGKTLEKLVHKYLDRRCIVAESDGGAPMITRLVEEHWDHIFFTGSVSVGRIIYQAAAKFLTPVTLELGGKNPCIIDGDVDIDLAAKRIAWGKFFNCGQTCITADYILIHKDVEKEFIERMKHYIKQFYGENPQSSKDFCRIISSQHVKRLAGLFKHGEVVCGGQFDEKDRYVAPTLIRNVNLDSELMTDEIFGPVLPLIPISSVDEAIEFINKRPLPLALYLFSKNKAEQDKVLARTRSGACVLNELLLHFTNAALPFGGVGDSGIGQYHGKLTFDTFVHRKAVIKSTTKAWLDLPLRYPPYTDAVRWVVDKVTRSGW